MPSRKWHHKSKSGCLQCKAKRIKCDESKPACEHCTRSCSSCHYPDEMWHIYQALPLDERPEHHCDEAEMEPDSAPVVRSQYRKRWHMKSRRGCLTCRRRRIKCDEETPSCHNCNRTKLVCEYPCSGSSTSGSVSSDHDGFSIPPRLFIARLNSLMETLGFEYFHLYILPMFQTCQPSVLWRSTITFSAQTNDTIRRIMVALGFQQRLLEDAATSSQDQTSARDQSDIFYGSCVSSLRQTLTTMSIAEAPIVALCCALMIALECLRDSAKNLLVHLHSGIRLIIQTAQVNNLQSVDEMRDIVALFQNLCISAWMFGVSPSYVGDFSLTLQALEFDGLCSFNLPEGPHVSSYEIYHMLSDLIYTVRQLMHPLAKAEDRRTLFDQLYRIRAKAAEYREQLVCNEAKSANRNFSEAKLIMTEIWLSNFLTQSADALRVKEGFSFVLDLLEESLMEVKHARHRESQFMRSHPFTVGTGAIYILETILRTSNDSVLEYRALSLLQLCAPREGLWRSERVVESYYGPKITVQRRTLVTEPNEKLATAEDCVTLAAKMLEDLKMEDSALEGCLSVSSQQS